MAQAPRDEWVLINGLSFHYRNWGGSGQPLVLLHGLASTCHIWDLVAPILANDFAVVALDQRGHGESEKPDYGYDFASVAKDLEGFFQARDLDQPIIVGHSWGADVALAFAIARPDVPRGLCFVDGGMIEPSARPNMTLELAKAQMAPPDFSGVTVEGFIERVRSRDLGPLTPQVEKILLANFQVLEDNTIRARLSRDNHMRIIEALWEHRPSALFPRVQCPVLLMPARQLGSESTGDRRLRREASVTVAAKSLPVSKTVWLEDSIHDVPLQRPGLVARVIREHFEEGFFQ